MMLSQELLIKANQIYFSKQSFQKDELDLLKFPDLPEAIIDLIQDLVSWE